MQTTEPPSLNQQTNQQILDLLFGQTLRLTISLPLVCLISAIWLFDVAPFNELILWVGLVTVLSIGRIFIHNGYKKHCDMHNQHLWLHAWVGISVLISTLTAGAYIYFAPLEQPVYAVSVGLYVIALSSVTVIGYGVSLYGTLGIVIPLIVIPSYFLVAQGGFTGLMTAIVILFYAGVIFILLKNYNNAFKKSTILNYKFKQEIAKRILVEQQLQDLSRKDGLTGLFNRRYFDEMLEIEIARANRNHVPLCLLMIDIDCFKEYNDHYGHVAGDNCLIMIANFAQKLANRKGDLTARYGGEEFAIILPNVDLSGATTFAEKLQKSIAQLKIPHEKTKLTGFKVVTASVGVANLTPFSNSISSTLIKAADEALYEAKRQGRNSVQSHDNSASFAQP